MEEKKKNAPSTYKTTERKINAFCQETKDRRTGRAIWSEDTLRFEDITVDWLRRFDAFLETTAPSPNARSIHMRNIRAVFRDAMRERATGTAYPFDGFRIEKRATKDRSVSVDDLRRLWSVSTDEHISWYLDYFKLSFLLCGANIADIAGLRTLHNGRAEFLRKKTGQPVSVLVQPEAAEIIERRAGRDGWLLDIHDRYKRPEDFLNRLNKALKKIGKVYNPHTKRWDGETAFPELSYYCARYSWATIATELDVPERTVGAALGHASSSVTSIYTRTDMRRKVDAANRSVIDLVLYDKRL